MNGASAGNIAIGSYSMYNSNTGTNNLCIGHYTSLTGATGTNQIVIGRGVILVKGKSLKVVSATIFNSKSVIKDQIDKTLFDKSTIEDNYGKRAQSGKVIKNYKNQIMNRNFENNIRCHL